MPDIYNTEESVDSLREINRLNESIIRRSRTTVQIYDNFSSSLSNVTSRFGRLQNIINNLNRGSSQIFNTSYMRNSSIQIETVEESYRNMSNTIAEVSQSQDDLNRSMDDTKKLSIDWKSLAGSASVIANFADGVSNAKAKIQQMSGGLENMKSLQSSIMQSAQRTGTSYTDMVNSVSQLSSMKNVFGSNNEALAFTELMSKDMSANGVTGESQSAAMDQIIQSMSSGNIGADTTQLLAQTSPIMTQGLQEYMNNIRGVEGSLQEMAGQGLITTNDMRNAMFMSVEDIEQSFASAPMTFGQRKLKRFFNI